MATLRETFSNIADAIRAKGISGTMTPLEMPSKIANIPSGGGTTYGATVENLVGKVNDNGEYVPDATPFDFQMSDLEYINNATGNSKALSYKFYYNQGIRSLSLPNLKSIDFTQALYYMCYGAENLVSVSMPKLETVNQQGVLQNAFRWCISLVDVDMSGLTTVFGLAVSGLQYMFNGCTSLKRVHLNKLSTVSGLQAWNQTFAGCTSLELVDFSEATAIPALNNANIFNNTNSTFKIVVPDALYDSWVAASNWSNFASHFVKASEYTPAS